MRAIFGDLTGDAYEFNATLPAKEKLIEQNHAHIEDQERVKARNQAEIAAQNQELEQLKASVAEFKTKYGDALRFEELKQKNAEQEATLREGRRQWEDFKKSVRGEAA